MTQQTGGPAIVAKRTDGGPVDTTEIAALADVVGYRVVEAVTQSRAEDPGSYIGRGKLAELERKLEQLPRPAAQFRERRREQGFDLVTVAGYSDPDQPRDDPTAAVEGRLFKTLETTTRPQHGRNWQSRSTFSRHRASTREPLSPLSTG